MNSDRLQCEKSDICSSNKLNPFQAGDDFNIGDYYTRCYCMLPSCQVGHGKKIILCENVF